MNSYDSPKSEILDVGGTSECEFDGCGATSLLSRDSVATVGPVGPEAWVRSELEIGTRSGVDAIGALILLVGAYGTQLWHPLVIKAPALFRTPY